MTTYIHYHEGKRIHSPFPSLEYHLQYFANAEKINLETADNGAPKKTADELSREAAAAASVPVLKEQEQINNLHHNIDREDKCSCYDDEYEEEEKYTELNVQTLLQIEQNDPAITTLYWKLHHFVNLRQTRSYNISRVGDAIASNIHLKKLDVGCVLTTSLCEGIAKNRSIEHLHLRKINDLSGEMLSTLSPFFKNNSNLCCLRIEECGVDDSVVTAIASTLSTFCTLKNFHLSWNDLNGNQTTKIIHGLRGHHDLAVIDLSMNEFEKKTWLALGEVLKESKVQSLDIGYCDIDDECATILRNALQENNTLKKLMLNGQGVEEEEEERSLSTVGWRTLFSIIRSHSLEDFSIYDANIRDAEALVLAEYITNNSALRSLNLGTSQGFNSQGLGQVGWRAIFNGVQTAFSLEKLDISEARGINGNDLAILLAAATINGTMKELSLDNLTSITSRDWQNLARTNRLSMLGSSTCKLKALYLSGNNINDDVVVVLAQALVGNTCLKKLAISDDDDEESDNNITARGWGALSTLLCNRQSIESTYLSNHTIECINTQFDCLTDINKNNSREDAVREKIMKYHFKMEDGTVSHGMRVVCDMEWPVLAQAASWMGRKRDNAGYTIMFELMRSIPGLGRASVSN